jgi:hypothetical protein
MRLGFFLGFLIGGAIASVIARSPDEVEHAIDDARELASDVPGATRAEAREIRGKIKHHVEEARDAAKEAQLEKEAEMLRMYEEMVHRPAPPSA